MTLFQKRVYIERGFRVNPLTLNFLLKQEKRGLLWKKISKRRLYNPKDQSCCSTTNSFSQCIPNAQICRLVVLSMWDARISQWWNMSTSRNNLLSLPSRFTIKFPFASLFSAHLILIYLIIRKLSGEECICYLLQSHFNSSLLHPNIFPSNLAPSVCVLQST